MTRISTPSALLGGFGWFRALTGGHGLVAQNRLLVGKVAGCDCGGQIAAKNSRWDLAAQGRFNAGTESLAAVGLNGGDRRRRSFNERPLVRLLHPQDRVLAGGRQQVSDEGPVSPSANWHFRPDAVGHPPSRKRSINPPTSGNPHPIHVDLLGAEAIVHVPNVLAQLVQNLGELQRRSAGFHRIFITGHASMCIEWIAMLQATFRRNR